VSSDTNKGKAAYIRISPDRGITLGDVDVDFDGF